MKTKFGFTLVELLVVISILGILITLSMVSFRSSQQKARDAARKSDMRNISTALRLYSNDKGFFPANNASGQILGCGVTGTSACTWGAAWVVGTSTYMNMLPKDPVANQSYQYAVGATGDTFTISACLENKNDVSGIVTANTAWCSTNWMFQIAQ